MASPNSGKFLSLKALVEKGSNKVIFVESDNAFVDVLLSFLTIPLGTIIKLGRKHGTVPVETGCFNNLYSSVEEFDEHGFLSQACREMLLHPRSVAEADCKNLKLQIANLDVKPVTYFVCSGSYCLKNRTTKLFSYQPGRTCPLCSNAMKERNVSVNDGSRVASEAAFVKCQARLLVTDDLQVIAPFTVSSVYLFRKLGITNRTTVEELTLNIGDEEVLSLLMSSLASKTPLTETLLKHKPVINPSNENSYSRAIIVDPSEVPVHGTLPVEEGNISVKLIISKSKKMVCYAQAGEDFVNLLFSFLTLPLGFVVKQVRDGSLKGCIDQLYSSVQDLDDEQYLKSNYHKETLLNPKLVPGHCYKCDLLGIEEATYYYSLYSGLTAQRLGDSIKCEAIEPSPSARGFLKGPAMFTVTDNLVIRPISTMLELSILDDLEVPVSDIEDKVVVMGKNEALSLLVASFVCDSALTRAFIG